MSDRFPLHPVAPAPHRGAAPAAGRLSRTGLVVRTVAWVLVMLLLVMASGALTQAALDRLRADLQVVVDDELDQLMDALRLVQQTEALISQSLLLSQARSQDERKRLLIDQQERLEWIRKITRQVASQAQASGDLLDRVARTQNQLGEGVAGLDELVAQRLRLASRQSGRAGLEWVQLEDAIARATARQREVGAELSVLMGYFASDSRARMQGRIGKLHTEMGHQQTLLTTLHVATLVLIVLLGLYLYRTVVLRIVRLQRAVSTQPVVQSDIQAAGTDEIALLADTLRDYVERIQANEARLERSNQDLAYLAEHDPLTRLANRRHFDVASRRMLTALNGALAVAVLDIDHFKAVNDTHGHDFGDRALVHVAHCLGSALRDRDVLARFGGEEFVALMPVASIDAALEVCERMRQAVASQPLEHGDAEWVHLRVSVGVAVIGGLPMQADGDLPAAIMHLALQAADAALYRAKKNGRDQVCANPGTIPASTDLA